MKVKILFYFQWQVLSKFSLCNSAPLSRESDFCNTPQHKWQDIQSAFGPFCGLAKNPDARSSPCYWLSTDVHSFCLPRHGPWKGMTSLTSRLWRKSCTLHSLLMRSTNGRMLPSYGQWNRGLLPMKSSGWLNAIFQALLLWQTKVDKSMCFGVRQFWAQCWPYSLLPVWSCTSYLTSLSLYCSSIKENEHYYD